MTHDELTQQIDELVARYPGITVVKTDGRALAPENDGTYRVALMNKREQIRGVWMTHYDLHAGDTHQLTLDLIEACDTLTRLMKETDE